MQVCYSIALPSAEDNVEEVDGSFTCNPASGGRPTLSDIKACWPFEGEFIFRAKLVPKSEPTQWLWFDLVNPDDQIALCDGIVVLRALPISHLSVQVVTPAEDEPFPLAADEYASWAALRRKEPISLAQFPLQKASASAWFKTVNAYMGGEKDVAPPSLPPVRDDHVGRAGAPADSQASPAAGEDGSFWGQEEKDVQVLDPRQKAEEWSGQGEEEGYEDTDSDLQARLDTYPPERDRDGLDESMAAAAAAAREAASAAASAAISSFKGFLGKAKRAIAGGDGKPRPGSVASQQNDQQSEQQFPF